MFSQGSTSSATAGRLLIASAVLGTVAYLWQHTVEIIDHPAESMGLPDLFNAAFLTKVHQDTYEGLASYYRDATLAGEVVAMYRAGLVLQEAGFMDASTKEGGPRANLRYHIYSNRGAGLARSFARYEAVTFPQGCYFKVLGTNEAGGTTLVTLLHLPDYAVPYFALRQDAREAGLLAGSLAQFRQVLGKAADPDLTDPYWMRRTAFPIGIDEQGAYFYRYDYGDRKDLDPLQEPPGLLQRWFGRKRG